MSQEPADNEEQKNAPPPSPISGRSEPNLPPHLREKVQKTDEAVVAKTKLDYDAVTEVVIETVARKEVLVAEQMSFQQGEPVKPFVPIENYENATPCAASTDKKDRVGFCEKCHWRYYDFTGMEMPQAEELVYKMEGLSKFKLYKRADGKFLTRDCPIGRKQKLIKVSAIAAATTLFAYIVILSILAPHPKVEPAKTVETSQPAKDEKPVTKHHGWTIEKKEIKPLKK